MKLSRTVLGLLLFCLPATAFSQAKPLTYWEHIKPITDAYCTTCHSPGNIAPFSLSTYQDVYNMRYFVAYAVGEKIMPPWYADPLHNYLYNTSLPEEHIQTIKDWVDQEAPEGSQDNQGIALEVNRGGIKRVDATTGIPELFTPQAVDGDEYRCFLLDWEATEDVFLQGYKVEAGNSKIVHHMALYLAAESQVKKVKSMVNEDERPGYDCFGGPYTKTQLLPMPFIGNGGPGNNGFLFPDRTGVQIKKGGRLVMQIHYSMSGHEGETDQTQIKMQLTKEKLKPGVYFPVFNPFWAIFKNLMKIPAGDANASHTYKGNPFQGIKLIKFLFPSDLDYSKGVKIYAIAPHMHERGKSLRMNIYRENGNVEPLFSVSNWNFHWQSTFFYETPVIMSPDDEIAITCSWDNSGRVRSAHGHRAIEEVPKDVYWGESTSDEMCVGAL
ncbi:MAG: hypothetical protein EOP04_09170, partial [Proteobacteria bacterium]